jgi:protein-S-isoprenylcysteine O-methyltransferase Ste14
MNKQKINYLVDFIAFLFFLTTAVSGLAIFFFMPSGVRQGKLQEFLGIQKGGWSEIHDWAGILLIIFVAIHFILHWNWIACMTKNIFQTDKCENKTDNNLK